MKLNIYVVIGLGEKSFGVVGNEVVVTPDPAEAIRAQERGRQANGKDWIWKIHESTLDFPLPPQEATPPKGSEP